MAGTFDPYAEWLGIKDKQRPLTNYQLLGLAPFVVEADAVESHEQQQLAKLVQFSKGEHSLLAKRIAFEIRSAKTCLLNPTTRASYDAGLRGDKSEILAARHTPPARVAKGEPSPARPPAPHAVARQTPGPRASQEPEPEEDCYTLAKPEPRVAPVIVRRRGEFSYDSYNVQPKRQFRRKKNRWLIPAVVGGAVIIVAGIAFVAAWGHANVKVADTRVNKNRKTVEPTKSQSPPPRVEMRVPESKQMKPVALANRTNEPSVESKEGRAKKTPSEQGSVSAIGQYDRHYPADKASEPIAISLNKTNSPNPVQTEREVSGRQIGRVPVSMSQTRGVQITLPSGAVLTESMFNVPKKWQEVFFSEAANVFVAKYPDNSVQGVFALDKAKLHGAAAVLHENGHLQTLATVYSHGNLDGCLRIWDKDGKRIFYAEYRNDRKHGVLCFFQDGMPWLIQECDKGKSQNEYLVKWTQDSPRILSTAQLTGEEIAEMSRAGQQLITLEETLEKNEVQLKIKLADWYRKEDQRIRQERFAAGTADRRATASNRLRAHNFGKSSSEGGFWRRALKGSGF